MVWRFLSSDLDWKVVDREGNKEIFWYLKKIFEPRIRRWVQYLYYWFDWKKSQTKWEYPIEVETIPQIQPNFWLLHWLLEENEGKIVENRGSVNISKKFEEKLERYYAMYEVPIAKRFKRDLEEFSWNIEREDYDNILENIIDEVLNLIYAFWDSLDPDEFEDILLKFSHESILWFTDQVISKYNALWEEKDLVLMYKHFALEWLTRKDWKRTFKNSLIKDKIEDHIWLAFEYLADWFLQWFYSNKPESKNLEIVYDDMQKLIKYVAILKNKNICFADLNIGKIKTNLLKRYWDRIKTVLKKDLEYKVFEEVFMCQETWDELAQFLLNKSKNVK